MIVDPKSQVMAEDVSNNESVIEAEIPIADFCRGRRIPRYPLELVKPVFDQYQQEIPMNHLDLPAKELPQTGEDMKALMDGESRWLD